MMLNKLLHVLRQNGFRNTLSIVSSNLKKSTIPNFENIKHYFQGNAGIEIGGPSKVFEKNNIIPIYPIVSSLDGINFSSQTIWSKSQNEYTYDIERLSGKLFICEATDLSNIPTYLY